MQELTTLLALFCPYLCLPCWGSKMMILTTSVAGNNSRHIPANSMHHVTAFIRSKELQLQLRRSPAPPLLLWPVAAYLETAAFGMACTSLLVPGARQQHCYQSLPQVSDSLGSDNSPSPGRLALCTAESAAQANCNTVPDAPVAA
jgi:hypothetical protein